MILALAPKTVTHELQYVSIKAKQMAGVRGSTLTTHLLPRPSHFSSSSPWPSQLFEEVLEPTHTHAIMQRLKNPITQGFPLKLSDHWRKVHAA